MPDLKTSYYHWTLPTIGADAAVWGTLLNNNTQDMDLRVHENQVAVQAIAAVVSGPNGLTLTCPAGQSNVILGQRAGVARWAIVMPDNEAEAGGGSNSGGNFLIGNFSDTGSPLATPFEIIRSTGQVVLGNGLAVSGGVVTVTGAATFGSTLGATGLASFGTGITFPNFNGGHTIQLGFDGTSARIKVDSVDLGAITTSTTPGAYLPLTGGTISGNLAVGGTLAITGAATFSSTLGATGAATVGSLSTAGAVTSTGGFVTGTTQYFNNAINFNATGGYKIIIHPGVGDIGGFEFTCAAGELAEIDGDASFFINGQGHQPGGGVWINSSDARIKKVERTYEPGLQEILDLEPVIYRYKANDAAPGRQSRHERVKHRSFVGLVAQDVEKIFPDMVTKRKGWVDGVEVDDLRDLDTSELVFALVNAVKTLSRRIVELESR
jgi:hypothetical protein